MTRMRRTFLGLMGVTAVIVGHAWRSGLDAEAQGPSSAAEEYRRALDQWEAGRYHEALPRLIALLESGAGAAYLERIALLTGEWYPSVEIAFDGRNPRLSPDGHLVTYELGPTSNPTTRIVRAEPGAKIVAEVSGNGAVINAAGTHVAWLRPGTNATTAPGDNAQAIAWALAKDGEIVIRDLRSGSERRVDTGGLLKTAPTWAANGRDIYFVGSSEADGSRSNIYRAAESGAPVPLTQDSGFKTLTAVDASDTVLLYTSSGAPTFRRPATESAAPAGGGRGAGGRGGGASASFSILTLATGASRTINGTGATLSADGRTVAWVTRTADGYSLFTSPAAADTPTEIRSGRERIDAPALSPDGSAVAYQFMQFEDWEIYISRGTAHDRLTRDIQHDVMPRFLTNTTLLGMMGEARHRRSQVYDLPTKTRRRLLHNNTIRTVVPEYSWQASADGRTVLTVADYDGDTVSTERGLYVTDLSRTVTLAEVVKRLRANLAHETDLRSRVTKMFEPIAGAVRTALSSASVGRVYDHAKALYDFDSKHISQPGNAKAIEYLTDAYRSFGYEPQQQWFDRANALGGKTANVLATLKGTVDPDLIYVVSSHFDSVAIGPGADDDTSGTTALLEAARLLAKTPMPATIVFASFTGEEAGLLGSREFVRQAGEQKWNVRGALNNDMIGWSGEGPQLNNTIRFSNAGIRDIQHGAAFLFTNLVLFDSKYYRSTDAQAFYDAWGDVVGGIGSYPILANPHYHQPTDYLDTINQHQVLETAKVTAATLMYLASSPSRLRNLAAVRKGDAVALTWDASPETGVTSYIVAYGPAADPLRTRVTVSAPTASLPSLPAGTHVAVKALNARGLEGWDWARAIVQ